MPCCMRRLTRFLLGVDGPGHAIGSHLKGFDLSTGDGKISAQFPVKTNLCNDMTVPSDGTVYVTNSLAPQILQLKPGGKTLEVWVENKTPVHSCHVTWRKATQIGVEFA